MVVLSPSADKIDLTLHVTPILVTTVSSVIWVIRVIPVAIVIVIIWVAICIPTLFYPPVIIIWCTRVLCIPVIWLVPLVVTRMISVGWLLSLIHI